MGDDAPQTKRIRWFEAAAVGLLLALIALGIRKPWSTPAPSTPRDDSGVAKLGPAAVTTPTGLRYEDLVPGNGAVPKTGQTVVVHYLGRLTNGTEFDGSRKRGEAFKFPLGQGRVIKGWDEGISTMHTGGVRRLVVPPDLGYGSNAAPGGKIPANSTLVFDVELLGIE